MAEKSDPRRARAVRRLPSFVCAPRYGDDLKTIVTRFSPGAVPDHVAAAALCLAPEDLRKLRSKTVSKLRIALESEEDGG